jgi:hypothetical protein
MLSDSLFTKCTSCGKDVPKSSIKCLACGKFIKKLSAIQWIGIILLCLIAVGIINSPENPQVKEEILNPNLAKQGVMNDVALEYTWTTEGFGTVMKANLQIKNNSTSDIKDIQIQCDHFAKSGTKIDSNNRTIYEIINAKSSKRFFKYNMGFIRDQVHSTYCYIKNISLADL